YLMAWPFFKVLGLDYYAARYSVAFWGTLGAVLFFFASRSLAGARAALVATAFFATSMVTLAASRAAYVQGPILFWTVVVLLLYVEAQKRRSLVLALLTGVAVVLGLLTYQTFVTVPVAIALHMVYVAARDLWDARSLRSAPVFMACLIALPTVVMSSKIAEHFETMRGYSTSGSDSLTAIKADFWDAPGDYISQAMDNAKVLAGELFRQQSAVDFLVTNSDGPVILPGVMLLALVGVAILLSRVRDRWPSLLLIWLAVSLGTSPVVLGAHMARTFLSAFPAVFIAAGIGASALVDAGLQSIRAPSLRLFRPAIEVVLAGTVVALSVFGALIYFEKSRPTPEGEIRASFVDNVLPLIGASDHLVLPYAQSSGDWFDVERNAVRFILAGKYGGFDYVGRFSAVGPHREVLTMLQKQGASRTLIVIRDEAGGPPGAARAEIQKALAFCYPDATWTTVPHFRVAAVANATQSRCKATLELSPKQTPAKNPEVLEWIGSPEAGPFALSIERLRDDVRFYEMETFEGGNGWGGEARYAADYTGQGYFFDDVIATAVSIEVDVPASGSYELWLRTYRRVADDTHRFLTIEGRDSVEVSPPSGALLNDWVWERFGPYQLDAGKLRLGLRREGRGPALFIDAMYLVRGGGFDPRTDSAWLRTIEETIESGTGNQHAFDLKGKLGPGVYRWRVAALGEGVVDGLGGRLVSKPQEFAVE
ncbi:MAG TPA: glycosyltransferase family 39 protein, partial [Dehalococcoidia bacterium]|nr:glycosyltransferase family 39 protein [Dehalococcoidia bacterium]